MIIVPFESVHLSRMHHQNRQAPMLSYLLGQYADTLPALGPAYTALEGAQVIACAGIAVQGFGIGILWAWLAIDSGRHFVRLDRCVRRLIAIEQLRRLEATAEAGFPQGCRWLELLGFQSEGLMRQYGPDGADHIRYARVF